MTEIDEVAEAIKAKYPMLWPMTAYQASYIAKQEAGDQGDTIVNLVAQGLLKLNPREKPALKETFKADLFDVLHASELVLVYDEAYELIGEAQGFFPVGDDVRIEIGAEEFDFPDQPVVVNPDGAIGVISSTGRSLFMELNMARPFTSADLEAFKCKQQRATTEPQ